MLVKEKEEEEYTDGCFLAYNYPVMGKPGLSLTSHQPKTTACHAIKWIQFAQGMPCYGYAGKSSWYYYYCVFL